MKQHWQIWQTRRSCNCLGAATKGGNSNSQQTQLGSHFFFSNLQLHMCRYIAPPLCGSLLRAWICALIAGPGRRVVCVIWICHAASALTVAHLHELFCRCRYVCLCFFVIVAAGALETSHHLPLPLPFPPTLCRLSGAANTSLIV